jgi:hypothetical protein
MVDIQILNKARQVNLYDRKGFLNQNTVWRKKVSQILQQTLKTKRSAVLWINGSELGPEKIIEKNS